jgi:hypothetical protein
VVGVIACWFFWRYLLFIKPDVSISPFIAMSRNETTGRPVFRFKIYNKGNRQVIGITLNAWVCRLIDAPGGQISRALYRLPIPNSETRTLNPKDKSERPWGLSPDAYLSSEPEFDLLQLLADPNRKILITLRTTDALSGTTVVKQKTFERRQIKEGMFRVGERMEVEPFAISPNH